MRCDSVTACQLHKGETQLCSYVVFSPSTVPSLAQGMIQRKRLTTLKLENYNREQRIEAVYSSTFPLRPWRQQIFRTTLRQSQLPVYV